MIHQMQNPPLRCLLVIALLSVVWVPAANAASITTHPNSATVNQGQPVALTVAASVSGGATYQWFKDGVRIPSATGSSYSIASCQPWHIGDYTVSVTDSVNTATSNPVTVSINGVNSALWMGLMAYLPFNGGAQDATAFANNGTAHGTELMNDRFGHAQSAYAFCGPLNSTWTSGTAHYIDVPDSLSLRPAKNLTLSLWVKASVNDFTGYVMMVTKRITNSNPGPFNSWVIATPSPNTTQIVYGADNRTDWPNVEQLNVFTGGWQHFVMTVTDTKQFLYVDGVLKEETDVTNTPFTYGGESLLIGTAKRDGSQEWFGALDDIRVYNRALSASEVQALYVSEFSPVIATQPQPQTVYETYPATFSITATGTGTLHYQWRRGTTNIPTATSSSYTIPAAGFADAVSYNVLVTDDVGTTQSDDVTLSVISRAPNANITPGSPAVNPNSPITFTANIVTGIAPFTYQWRKNGTKLTGATASSYTIASAQQSHEGSYDCVVTNAFGSMTAAAAILSVNDPVIIVVPPLTQSANVDDEVTLHVTAGGTGPFTYQWRRNSTPIDGETNPDLTFTATALSGGVYDVVVTNVVGSVTSLPATLTVLTPPVITADPVDQLVAAGGTAIFSVTAAGPALTYQWRRNEVALTGKTSASLQLFNVQAANAGRYDVVVKNAYGTVICVPATLMLSSALNITMDPVDSTNDVGTTATFTVVANGPGVLTYQWFKDGAAITNAKSASLNVVVTSAAVAGSYTVTVTSGTLKASSAAAFLRVNDGGLLIYNFTSTGTVTQLAQTSGTTASGVMIVDRANQRGGFIWFSKSGTVNTFVTEIREDLHTHSTGPINKSQTVMTRVDINGTPPDENLDILWLRGSDSLLSISTTDKTMGPLTLSGTLNTLELSDGTFIRGLSLSATLDAAASSQARQAGETVERTVKRLSAGLQLKGYVRE